MKPARPDLTHGQRGIALITVLLIFVMATAIAGDSAQRVFLTTSRLERQLVEAQAWEYALAGETFARQLLHKGLADAEPVVEEGDRDRDRGWLLVNRVEKFEQGELNISILDLQSRFNINNLVGGVSEDKQRALQQFTRLLDDLTIEPAVTRTLLDWIEDVSASPESRAGDLSGGTGPGYGTGNRLLAHLSELYELEGVDKGTLMALAPYITALPPPTAINMNTASDRILQAMASATEAEAPATEGRAPADDPADDPANAERGAGCMAAESCYFMVFVKSVFADQSLSLRTVFYRSAETNQVRMLSRDRGADFLFRWGDARDEAQS
ncbi:MAG: type II secretion system minor pseudopilin GspK [Gammaproteobacteria bacterium]|nr:type II secretion system minor pseudopilin GspK [Gammaproteobacteria bacterium]MCY4282283.1 type II secretion system minor pseudopilin GspK [Gammaproteobacteria bacterium]MCY4339460.1 type II secretion system minor pseudopilin GspK [Gammaproteobacteria bacterium]